MANTLLSRLEIRCTGLQYRGFESLLLRQDSFEHGPLRPVSHGARSGTLKLRVPPYRYKSRASCAKYPIACVKKGGTQGKWPATGAALQSVSETLPANAPRASMAFSAAVEVL